VLQDVNSNTLKKINADVFYSTYPRTIELHKDTLNAKFHSGKVKEPSYLYFKRPVGCEIVIAEDMSFTTVSCGTNLKGERKSTALNKEEMLDRLFQDIEVETEGMVPVRWRGKGSNVWKECKYEKEE
jgi:hypothetical protein